MGNILFNGLQYEKNGAGISRYTEMLMRTFIEEDYDIDILIRKQLKNELTSGKLILSTHDINNSKDRIIYEQVQAQKVFKKYEIVHFPDYATPVLYKGNKIATIHDLAMHTMRDKYTLSQNLTKNILLKNTINSSNKIICVSEFAKRELINYYPKIEEKIEVIYEGIDLKKINIDQSYEEKVLNKFNIIKNKYILYVGTIAPHKNIKKLIESFNYISSKIPEYKLVIAGKMGWMYDEVFEEVEKLNSKDRIVFTDKVSELVLETLYKNAGMFTSISLYEGFGFPPLEAMARKIPVLVSDIEIFKETCKDCVVYCNPNEIEDISDKILGILNNKINNEKQITKAYERVKIFNWKETAKKTYDVYKSIMK